MDDKDLRDIRAEWDALIAAGFEADLIARWHALSQPQNASEAATWIALAAELGDRGYTLTDDNEWVKVTADV